MAKYRPNLHIPNPLPYVDGQKLGEFLRQNKYPKAKPQKVKTIVIPDAPVPRRRGPKAY